MANASIESALTFALSHDYLTYRQYNAMMDELSNLRLSVPLAASLDNVSITADQPLRYGLFSFHVPRDDGNVLDWILIGRSVLRIASVEISAEPRTSVQLAGYHRNITWEFDNNALTISPLQALRKLQADDRKASESKPETARDRARFLAHLLEVDYPSEKAALLAGEAFVQKYGGTLYLCQTADYAYSLDTMISDIATAKITPRKTTAVR